MESSKCPTMEPQHSPETGGDGEHMPIQAERATVVPVSDPNGMDSYETDPLRAITGVVWGALAGGALWLTGLIAVAIIRAA